MKEQTENENKNKKKKPLTKEKRFYLISGISALAAMVAIVVIAVLVSSLGEVQTPTGDNSSITEKPVGGDTGNGDNNEVGDGGDNGEEEEPVITTPEGMIMPMVSSNVMNDYGFYHNKTLNNYYEHMGMDFSAEVGTEVLCVEDGVVEGIYRDDVLTGTEIVIDHGNGIKSVYRFIDVAEGVVTGKAVKKGEVIATVAEANGEEYKDGAHLHFELKKDGSNVDPISYLPFEEK